MGKFEKANRPAAAAAAQSAAPMPKSKKKKKSRLPLILGAAAAVVVVVGGIVIGTAMTRDDGRIASNVHIAGVDVGGMTKEDAKLALERQLSFDAPLQVNFYGASAEPVLYTTTYDPANEVLLDLFGQPVTEAEEESEDEVVVEEEDADFDEDEEETEEETEEVTEETTEATEATVDPKAPLDEDGEPMALAAELTLEPEDTQVHLDIEAAVDTAYKIGREHMGLFRKRVEDGQRRDLEAGDYLVVNETNVRALLDNFAAENCHDSKAPTTEITTVPYTDADGNDIEAKAVQIVLGDFKRDLDVDALYEDVLQAFMNGTNEDGVYEVIGKFEDSPAEAVDLDALYEKHCTPPVSAVCDMDTFEITPEVLGYGFDLAAAVEAMEGKQPNDTVILVMGDLVPRYTSSVLQGQLFKDVLGSYDSPYPSNPPRTTNLRLACEAINGTIVRPGEVFSFNETVGERTAEKGFQEAGVYVGGRTENQLGGGVCQVASVLYYCSLQSEFEIIQRVEHAYVPSYIPYGMDATIYWPKLDYKFRNTSDYPIRIDAVCKDGYVSIQFVGTEVRDYTVRLRYETVEGTEDEWESVKVDIFPGMKNYDKYKDYSEGDTIQVGYTGRKVTTYRARIDANGDVISEEIVNHSTYARRDKEVAHIVRNEPTMPTQRPTETPTERPTTQTTPETEPTEPETEPTEPETEPTTPEPTDPEESGEE